MPLFLDVHSLDDPVTLNDVPKPTTPTCAPRGRTASTICATGWTRQSGKIFCLVDAPSADVAADVHREAHGLVAQEIYQVTEGGADMTIDARDIPRRARGVRAGRGVGRDRGRVRRARRAGRAAALGRGLRPRRPTPGETFLDVAAGPGGLGLAAARRGATVLATDWAPAMVAQFESRARSEGLANAPARVMDAHALDLEDERFDVTGSQFGVMLVPDQAVALREMVRVTKPGGRVLLIAYGSPAEFDALQFFIAALQTVAPSSKACRIRRRWSSRSRTPTCCASVSLPRA